MTWRLGHLRLQLAYPLVLRVQQRPVVGHRLHPRLRLLRLLRLPLPLLGLFDRAIQLTLHVGPPAPGGQKEMPATITVAGILQAGHKPAP